MINKMKIFFMGAVCSALIAGCGGEDDEPSTDFSAEVTVTTNDATAKEGDNDASFTIQLNKTNTSDQSISVPYTVTGTATAGSDYSELSGVATIASGQTSATVSVKVTDDDVEESDETVILTLGNLPDNISAGSSTSATVTIQDNDAPATVTYTLSVEGTTTVSESSAEAVFTIALDKANDTGSAITVNYDVSGTATAGADFTAPAGSVTINNGETQADVSIPIIDDSDDESDETVVVTLSSAGLPSSVSLGTSSELSITITDNDDAVTGTAVSLAFGSTSGNSITIDSWTDVGAGNYIIVMNNQDSFTDLADADNPAFSTTYNGGGEQVVYNGPSITAMTITLLETSTTYYFKVYPAFAGVVDNSQLSESGTTVTCSTSSTTISEVCFDISSDVRTVTSNQYPNHATGSFPNADVTPIALTVTMDFTPSTSGSITYVYDETSGPGPTNHNFYEFGIASNGVSYDPMGLKPWVNPNNGEENWAWQAKVVDQNGTFLDSYGGHVNSSGKYHYHGDITGLANEDGSRHSRIYGFAADGFPIYYKYGYSDPNDATSAIMELKSSYQLKLGTRPGDGTTAPSGSYDGTYIQDYEYVSGLGDLDECNGRTGVTPEYPKGTYYYVITSDFPKIPNCFKGTPDAGFAVGAK